MRKTFLLLPLIGIVFSSCQKPNVTVYSGPAYPAFTLSGVQDISIRNGSSNTYSMAISVQYMDSAQETVSLALSSLPPGIATDTTILLTGIPTFSTGFIFYDTTQNGATPGTYPMTITATGSRSGAKVYNFNMKILPAPSYTAGIVGAYHNSINGCTSNSFSDSVYNDPAVVNKIWFSNFGGYGIQVYGTVNSGLNIHIPSQTVSGYTVSGSGYVYGAPPYSYISFSGIQVIHNSITNFCTISDHP